MDSEPMTEKACSTCKKELPISDFYKSGYGYNSRCRKCSNAYNRKWVHNHNYPISVVEKECRSCHVVRNAMEFTKNKTRRDGLEPKCKLCLSEYRQQHIYPKHEITTSWKICTRCKEFKDASCFHRDRTSLNGLSIYCKSCHRKDENNYLKTLKGYLSRKIISARVHSRQLNREFSITTSDIFCLWNKQDGKCYYTGIKMEHHGSIEKGSRNSKCVTIDRIDSERGYVADNVVLCCWAINSMKSNMNVIQFVEWCSLVSGNIRHTL